MSCMAEPKARQTFGKKKTIVFIAIGLFLLALFLSFWFGAMGGGEYKDSSNGKYIARQSLYTQRTLLNGEIQYVRIEVEEKATGKVIWEMTYRPPAGSNPYLYGDRSREFIRWESDSSAVHFPMDTNGMEITLPIP